MKPPEAPRLDTRRTEQFREELLARARAWIPGWDLSEEQRDFGRALLDIAARFNAEVTERLDGAGDKMRRSFLDWLAVGREAARPSRLPVVFKLSDNARTPVLADAPVRLQADAAGVPVVFETEKDVRLIPGTVGAVVAVDADADAFYLPAPGLSDLQPLEPLPTEWQLRSFAAADASKLQVTPDTGLTPDMLVEIDAWQYRVTEIEKDIITIEPPLGTDLPAGTPVRKVSVFAPYESGVRNRQAHALYLGHMDLLNLESPATIDVVGAQDLGESVEWQYFGKLGDGETDEWQPLTLADDQKSDAVVLRKEAGAVAVHPVNGISSRWIRAYMPMAEGNQPALDVDAIQLRINCLTDPVACPTIGDEPPSPAAEALANTTPLVLDKTFFPLGKEPRQFDAFYLGSKEAFSKKAAKVQLCLELANPSFLSLSPIHQLIWDGLVVAGVGRDRALHILTSLNGVVSPALGRDPLQPPAPGGSGIEATGNAVPLDLDVAWRLPFWFTPAPANPSGLFIAVTAGDSVWVWNENTNTIWTGWLPFGQLEPDTQTPSRPVDGLVFMDGAQKMAALRGGVIYLRTWPGGTTWDPVITKVGLNDVLWKVIAPINISDGSSGLTTSNELFGISEAGKLFRIATDGTLTPLLAAKTFLPIAPVAFLDTVPNPAVLTVVAVQAGATPKLVARQGGNDKDVALPANSTLVGGLDLAFDGTQVMVLACVADGQSRSLVTWTPFDQVRPVELFATSFPAQGGQPAGTPTRMLNSVLVPTASAVALSAPFDLNDRKTLSTFWRTAVVTRDEDDQIVVDDYLAIPTSAASPTHVLAKVTAPGVPHAGKTLHEFAFESIKGDVFVYRAATTSLSASITAPDRIRLPLGDSSGTDDILLITTDKPAPQLYRIDTFNSNTRVATLDRDLEYLGALPASLSYKSPESTLAALRPLLRLSGASANWETRVLDRTKLLFPGANPKFQSGEAFQVDAAGHPELVVLGDHWITAPPVTVSGAQFVVDGAVGDFTAQLGDTSTNPELSWEYSNGKGWWGLDIQTETTRHLKTTGVVRFTVPSDIAESDWAGKTNFWIRARLIGGDYGKEKVTVTTKDLGNNKTEQTVDRSTAGIRAPSIVNLHISYRVCTAVPPSFVLAQDSGSYRDQSDANRTPGAMVEAFVPLAVTLGRLANTVSRADAQATEPCPPDCQCPGTKAEVPAGLPAGTPPPSLVPVENVPPATGRALLIGLTSPPSEAPVNVLLLVDRERDFSALAPMTVEALMADRFVPLVVDDASRAIGESGLLSLSFTVPPTPRELFGQTMSWLRLTPGAPPAGAASLTWSPTLRGTYLNAAWASATETLTRELLGSSDGAPGLRCTLARPPVLRDTLELRVREPLGEEERTELAGSAPDRVRSNDENLPGDWVLWTRVTDPGDEGPAARVYALDEATGVIAFGDGLHGMIPPTGRDSIVAFSYQRTETGASATGAVPGNSISARTAFNLVSPVESVESVIAADQAAGGAPPESDERVLRFGYAQLRHRRRAVTAQDLEDLALQSSPDIAQVRCLLRQSHVTLVVVMGGSPPQPNAAQLRELRRLLLGASPAALAAPGALRIQGPAVRKLRLHLKLQVPGLDMAGDVAEETKRRLARLFDTATGGAGQQGWQLGENPTEGDIAYALIDLPDLDSIERVTLHEVEGRRTEQPWPESLKPNELAVLDADPVRIEFVTSEVAI